MNPNACETPGWCLVRVVSAAAAAAAAAQPSQLASLCCGIDRLDMAGLRDPPVASV